MSLTTAYAGHGDTTPENVAAVLNVFLPDNLGMVYVPARVPRFQSGLKKAVAWLEGEVGQAGTIPVPDLIDALLQRNKDLAADGKDPDDLTLVMLYDESKDDDVELAQTAIAAGINVVNLCAAGDDLLLDDAPVTFTEEEVADEPEVPADEKPPWLAEPDEPADKPVMPSPADVVAKAAAAGVMAAEQVMADARSAALRPDTSGVTISFHMSQESVDSLAAAIVAAMGGAAMGAMAAVQAADEEAATGATVTDINAKADSPDGDAPEGTRAFYYNSESGMYRPARGMARKTEKKVHLDAREVSDIKASKLLA